MCVCLSVCACVHVYVAGRAPQAWREGDGHDFMWGVELAVPVGALFGRICVRALVWGVHGMGVRALLHALCTSMHAIIVRTQNNMRACTRFCTHAHKRTTRVTDTCMHV